MPGGCKWLRSRKIYRPERLIGSEAETAGDRERGPAQVAYLTRQFSRPRVPAALWQKVLSVAEHFLSLSTFYR